MEKIIKAEEKEALRTLPGYSAESYASIANHAMQINAFESTDRRMVFELTGHKVGLDGRFEKKEMEESYYKKIDPTAVIELKKWTEDGILRENCSSFLENTDDEDETI